MVAFFAGKFADRVKHPERIVAAGYAVMGIGFILYIFIDSIWELFAIQILIGSAEAFYSPAFDDLYSNHLTRNKGGREWGTWESLSYFTIATGAALGGLIASKFGFNAIFVMMALLCFF